MEAGPYSVVNDAAMFFVGADFHVRPLNINMKKNQKAERKCCKILFKDNITLNLFHCGAWEIRQVLYL